MKTTKRFPLLPAPLTIIGALLCFGTPALAVRPQEPAAATEVLPSAREVIDRFIEVTHVKTVLEKTSSCHVKGTCLIPTLGIKAEMHAWGAKPDRRVVTTDLAGIGRVQQGYDGKVAWMTHPMLGAYILKDTDLLQTKLESAYDSALKKPELYESMKTVGRENFEGKDCYKVELVAKPLAGMDVEKTREARTSQEFYEVASGLLIGVKSRQDGQLASGPVTSISSDYKDFGGQLMPAKTTVRQSGQEVVLTIDAVEYDAATDAATFAMPKEVEALLQDAAEKAAQSKPQ